MHESDRSRLVGVARFATARAWWVIAAWLAVTAFMNLAVPQIEEIAARDSSAVVPEDAPSIRAVARMDETFGDGRSESFLVVATERPGGLEPQDRRYLVDLAAELESDPENVSYVQDIQRPELRRALTSTDGEARYMLVGITGATGAPASIRQVTAVREVAHDLAPPGLTVAVTGPTATITDLAVETEHSVLRITVVTIGLISLILLLIYRAIAAPLIILTTVGLALGLSRAVTAWCGMVGVFTVSTFSGSFLTAVVLGAGTDYAVFLVSRYHEFRRDGLPYLEAVRRATTRIGGVIAGSGLTVMLATGCLLLADLGFFRTTGPAVAVSVGVTLAVALTLTPALLALAGSRGWAEPRRAQAGGAWERFAGVVAAAPGRMLVAAVVPLAALAALFPVMQPSYDSRASAPDEVESNVGYALMDRHFPVNEVLPDWILIEADHDLRNAGDLAALETVAAAVAREEGVSLVRGLTRPLGKPITQASVAHAAGRVGKGLDRAVGDLEEGEDGARQLADGAGELDDGAARLGDGAGRLAEGADQALGGADELVAGSDRLADGVRRILAGADRALSGSRRIGAGMAELATGLETAADNVGLAVDGLEMAYRALRNRSLTCHLDPACRGARDGIRQIYEAQRDELLPGLREAAAAARRLADGTADLEDGLARLRSGLARAEQGADRLAEGQAVFADRLGDLAGGARELSGGIDRLAEGTGRVERGTEEISASLPELRRGLTRAARVLQRMGDLSDRPAVSGFFLPPTALEDQRFTAARRLYLSPDGRSARIAVLGETDAWGPAAAERAVEIRETAEETLAGTRLEGARVSTTGMATTNADLADYSAADLRLIAAAALVAVFLVLLLLLRSLVASAVLMGTVVLSYAAAMGLSVLVWQVLLDHPLEWIVSAIAFVLLVAVGADYNLLLAKRIQEEAPEGSPGGIARATAATGTVITSAGVIFAASMFALMAGTVATVAQVGFTVGAGLLLDTFVVRSLVVPAAATLLGPRLWWPSRLTTAPAGSAPERRS